MMANSSGHSELFSILHSLFLLVLSLSLFSGGILLLFLKSDAWCILLGLTSTQLGIACLIISLDSIIREKIGTDSLKITICSVCKKPTITPLNQKDDICPECQAKVVRALESN